MAEPGGSDGLSPMGDFAQVRHARRTAPASRRDGPGYSRMGANLREVPVDEDQASLNNQLLDSTETNDLDSTTVELTDPLIE